MSDTLTSGQSLAVDGTLTATHGFARLTLQEDGNLVLYCLRPEGWVARWATGTNGQAVDGCIMQTDGHLVLLTKAKAPVWQTPGDDAPDSWLLVQDDENAVIYTPGDTPVWASNTSLDGGTIKGSDPTVWYLFQGVRHGIPDPETLDANFGGFGAVAVLTDEQITMWPEGDPEPSVTTTNLADIHVCIDQSASGPPPPARVVPAPPPRILPDGSVVGVVEQPLTGETDKMWDVGITLRVKMIGGTPFVRGKVRQFAEVWTQYANIHFAWVDASQPAEIIVSFEAGKGSWSYIGRDALWNIFGAPTMNFGWFTDDTSDTDFSTATHEFGHALGLVHEHQSPAAGIAWDREKVYAYFQETQGWDRAKVDADVFDKYSVTETNYSAFDPTSIMEYPIPAELTLDGYGVAGGTQLSATDEQYIRRWYPATPVPGAAQGLLRTGDDCDEIDFVVEYGVVDSQDVAFALAPASGLNWWKAIEIPIGAAGYQMFQMQDGHNASGTIPMAQIDQSRPIRFWKAKAFGIHTLLGYTWDVCSALPGGSRLSLTWKRDHC